MLAEGLEACFQYPAHRRFLQRNVRGRGGWMLRISRFSDYSFILLRYIALQDRPSVSAADAAEATGLPLPTSAKIMKLLARGGLLKSCRGAAGGYSLRRPAASVTVADVITALEGPLALTACVESNQENCHVEAACPLRGRWNRVNDAVHAALESVTLADMMGAPAPAAAPAFSLSAPQGGPALTEGKTA